VKRNGAQRLDIIRKGRAMMRLMIEVVEGDCRWGRIDKASITFQNGW